MDATTSTNESDAHDPQVPPRPIAIVIADDHPIFCDALKQLLSLEPDFEVVEQLRPDILLLDLKMPGKHGLSVLEKMQSVENNVTKVIVLTGSEDKNEFVQAMKLGTSGIVLKQSPTDLLLKSIRKVHAGEIWLDSDTTAAVMRQFATAEAYPSNSSNGRTRERAPLSQREREIVVLVAQGFKNKEMAQKMFISEQTIKNHLHNIFDKLGVSDRLELALYAIHKNIHTPV